MHSDIVSHRGRSFPCFTDTSWLFDLYRLKMLKRICTQVSLIWKEDAISPMSHSATGVCFHLYIYISEILTDQPRSTLLLSPWLLKDTYCTVNHDDVRKTTLEESNRVLQCLFFMAAHFVSMMIFSNTANKSKRLRSAELFRYLLDIRTTQPTSSVRLTVNRGLRAKKHWAFYFPVPNSRASGYSCAGYHQNALPGRVGWLSTAETAQYTCRGRLGS